MQAAIFVKHTELRNPRNQTHIIQLSYDPSKLTQSYLHLQIMRKISPKTELLEENLYISIQHSLIN